MPAKSNSATKDVTIEDLTEQIGKLKLDIAELADTIVELSASRKDAAIAGVFDSAEHIGERGKRAAHDAAVAASASVRESPMAALAIAAACGAAFGYFTARR